MTRKTQVGNDEESLARDRYKKNETRHSREAPHTNHIINNTKTNNRAQRYGVFADPQ